MGYYKQAMIAAGERLNRQPTHQEVLNQLDREVTTMGNYKSARDTLRHEMGRKPTHEEVKARLDELNLVVPSLNTTLAERHDAPTPTANYSDRLRSAAIERHQGPGDWPAPLPTKPVSCGNCKSTHPSAKAVRACYATTVEAVKADGTKLTAEARYYDNAKGGHCGRCAGTGQFITGVVNGKPTGPGGICFRCEGKGTQSCCSVEAHRERLTRHKAENVQRDEFTACCDVVRNDLFDRFGIRWNI